MANKDHPVTEYSSKLIEKILPLIFTNFYTNLKNPPVPPIQPHTPHKQCLTFEDSESTRKIKDQVILDKLVKYLSYIWSITFSQCLILPLLFYIYKKKLKKKIILKKEEISNILAFVSQFCEPDTEIV